MIDWDRVFELRSEIGVEQLSEVVELFLDEVEEVVMQLGSRPEKLKEDMHFLMGSAWNLGFRSFGVMCREGERKAATGRGAEVDIAAILACYGDSKAAFLARADELMRAA